MTGWSASQRAGRPYETAAWSHERNSSRQAVRLMSLPIVQRSRDERREETQSRETWQPLPLADNCIYYYYIFI